MKSFWWLLTILRDLPRVSGDSACWCSTENMLPISLVGRSLKLSLITHLWVCDCRMRGFCSCHQTVAVGNHFWSPIFGRSSSNLQQLVIRLTRIDHWPFANNKQVSTIAGFDKSLVIVRCLYDSRQQSHIIRRQSLTIADHHMIILHRSWMIIPNLYHNWSYDNRRSHNIYVTAINFGGGSRCWLPLISIFLCRRCSLLVLNSCVTGPLGKACVTGALGKACWQCDWAFRESFLAVWLGL